MKRRNFIENLGAGGLLAGMPLFTFGKSVSEQAREKAKELSADVVIVGGGLGGCAAALASLRNGLSVILTEETDWIGGQVSQQGVPPDEHQWIETHGAPATYRQFRDGVRDYYKRNYPLTAEAKARPFLNPGDGMVSRLCHEPRVAVAVLTEMLAPYISNGKLILLTESKAIAADVSGSQVKSLRVNRWRIGQEMVLTATYFVDATETGELLPMTGTEYVSGAESKKDTGELHAAETANPHNNQSFTMCFAMDYVKGENHVIEKPADYAFWQNLIPKMKKPWSGKLLDLAYSNPKTLEKKMLGFHPEGLKTGDPLNLWNYRKIINKDNFVPGTYPGDITVVNWPQNDYFLGDILDVSEKEFKKHVDSARQLSLSFLYWLQTEAPRPDGGAGWQGLRLRKDVMGTEDGLAKYPYIRESRRIKPVFRILEEHVGADNRKLVAGDKNPLKAAEFKDSVGIGYYHIDLHPSSAGDNYIDFASLPFQVPMGALIPQRMDNLLPANKNIGTTHITNGCYRLHPVEWSIGEAVGMLVATAVKSKTAPRGIHSDTKKLADFQKMIVSQGVETHWKEA